MADWRDGKHPQSGSKTIFLPNPQGGPSPLFSGPKMDESQDGLPEDDLGPKMTRVQRKNMHKATTKPRNPDWCNPTGYSNLSV